MGEALRQFLNQSRLKGSMQAIQIEEVWEEIMGKTIARYTDKIKIHGSTLYISSTVAPLKQDENNASEDRRDSLQSRHASLTVHEAMNWTPPCPT